MPRMRWRFVQVCAPVLARIPPWWALRLYNHLAGTPCEQGGFEGAIIERGIRPHGFAMALRLDDWMERFAAFTGSFYGFDVTATVERLLRDGDVFIDVGANVGFVSLTAARRVGPSGLVIAVDANPALAERLRECVSRNRIENIRVLNVAFGDKPGHARLHTAGHHGAATLLHEGADGSPCVVMRADDAIGEIPGAGRCLVKIDVEGYELLVLRGMSKLLQRPQTGFLVEVTDQWLRKANGSARLLFERMLNAGYRAFRPRVSKTSSLNFEPLDGHPEGVAQYDALFVRSADGWL